VGGVSRKKTLATRPAKKRTLKLVTRSRAKEDALVLLQSRVEQVEGDVRALKYEVDTVRQDLTALTISMRQIDERTIRGEKLLMEMQGEQRRTNRLLEGIAAKLEVPPTFAPTPVPFADPDKRD
jgi:SMC interacting uncharacterized protein involved in chromosome segregation